MKRERITFRLDEKEYKLLKKSQRKSGLEMSCFIRMLLFKKIKEIPSKEASDIQRVFLFEYSTVGKNINQIAKALNIIVKNNNILYFSEEQKMIVKSLNEMIERWEKVVRGANVINKQR